MKTKLIEIEVKGLVGTGKTHVCDVIKDALKRAYGMHTQVASIDLTLASAMHNVFTKPTIQDTVFVIREVNDKMIMKFEIC